MPVASNSRVEETPSRRGLIEHGIEHVVAPFLAPWLRETWRGLGNFPASGPVVVAANHLSNTDAFVFGRFLLIGSGRFPRFLGKAEVFAVPVIGRLLRHAGQIPVYRGSSQAGESFAAALAALDRGAMVALLPEGTLTRDPQLWPMSGKTGAARLALASGAPLIPVALWGPELILPPRVVNGRVVLHALRPHHPVTVIAGPPVQLDDLRAQPITTELLVEATGRLMADITGLLVRIRGEDPAGPPMANPRVASRVRRFRRPIFRRVLKPTSKERQSS